jgi:hypothetical protein
MVFRRRTRGRSWTTTDEVGDVRVPAAWWRRVLALVSAINGGTAVTSTISSSGGSLSRTQDRFGYVAGIATYALVGELAVHYNYPRARSTRKVSGVIWSRHS